MQDAACGGTHRVGPKLKGIHKSHGALSVIKGGDLSIDHGEFVVSVGPSGFGKCTLRMIAGLEQISGGAIFTGDTEVNDVEPRDRGVAMVIQSDAHYPQMSVYDQLRYLALLKGRHPRHLTSISTIRVPSGIEEAASPGRAGVYWSALRAARLKVHLMKLCPASCFRPASLVRRGSDARRR